MTWLKDDDLYDNHKIIYKMEKRRNQVLKNILQIYENDIISIGTVKSRPEKIWVVNELLDNIRLSIILLQLGIKLICNKFNEDSFLTNKTLAV